MPLNVRQPAATRSELNERYREVIEVQHHRPYMRDRGSVLLVCYNDDGQIWPSWIYQTLPWAGDDVIGQLSSVEVYLFDSELRKLSKTPRDLPSP